MGGCAFHSNILRILDAGELTSLSRPDSESTTEDVRVARVLWRVRDPETRPVVSALELVGELTEIIVEADPVLTDSTDSARRNTIGSAHRRGLRPLQLSRRDPLNEPLSQPRSSLCRTMLCLKVAGREILLATAEGSGPAVAALFAASIPRREGVLSFSRPNHLTRSQIEQKL